MGRVSSTVVCSRHTHRLRMALRYRWPVLVADDEIRPSEELPERVAVQGGGCCGEGVGPVGPMMNQRGFPMALSVLRTPYLAWPKVPLYPGVYPEIAG